MEAIYSKLAVPASHPPSLAFGKGSEIAMGGEMLHSGKCGMVQMP
jgi:hypothetical protein